MLIICFFKNGWGPFYALLTLIAVVVTLMQIPAVIEFYKNKYTSPTEKYVSDSIISGQLRGTILQPTVVNSEVPLNFNIPFSQQKYPPVKGIYIKDFGKTVMFLVVLNNVVVSLPCSEFYKGINLFKTINEDCGDANLNLIVRNDSLYVSAEFKYIQNEQTIGWIEFNHWNLLKSNMLIPYSTQNKLEVRDKQHNIVFSIVLHGVSPRLDIGGYFIGNKSILIIPNDLKTEYKCIIKSDTNWKKDAMPYISEIKSLYFKY